MSLSVHPVFISHLSVSPDLSSCCHPLPFNASPTGFLLDVLLCFPAAPFFTLSSAHNAPDASLRFFPSFTFFLIWSSVCVYLLCWLNIRQQRSCQVCPLSGLTHQHLESTQIALSIFFAQSLCRPKWEKMRQFKLFLGWVWEVPGGSSALLAKK